MRINCLKEDLLFGVQSVGKGISGRNTLPILNGILLIAEEGQLTLRATDLDIAIQCRIKADVLEKGQMVVADGRRFSDMVRQLPSGNINMYQMNDYDLKICYGPSNILLRGLDPEEFPVLPEQEGDITGSMPAETFCRMVKQVAPAAGMDETRAIFTGVFIEIGEGNVTMVANDTHRLAVSKDIFEQTEKSSVVVPAKTMQEVARIAAGNERVTIKISKNHVAFQSGEVLIVSRVINGQYPDYKQVIPGISTYTVQTAVNRQEFTEMVTRGASIAKENNGVIRLSIGDNLIKLAAHSPEVGEIKEEISASIAGETLNIAFNARYLLDALKTTDSENIVLIFTSAVGPALIKMDGDDSFLHLLLPIRMS